MDDVSPKKLYNVQAGTIFSRPVVSVVVHTLLPCHRLKTRLYK